MQLKAVAPANPAPVPKKAAPEAAEAPAVPFEETLIRAQAKGKPAADKPAPSPVAEARSETVPEEAPAEDAQDTAELALPEPAEPMPAELPTPDEPDEPQAINDEPAADPALLLAAMAAVPPAQPQQQASVEEPVQAMNHEGDALPSNAGLHRRQPLHRHEPAVSADVQPADAHERAEVQARTIQPALPDDPSSSPSAEQIMEPAELPARPEPALASPSNTPHAATMASAAPELRAPAAAAAAPSPALAVPQDAAFADTNHPTMIDAIRAQALPDGGRMQIRLDPPQLGALEIHVEVRDGVLTASFQTSNSEATRLLSHSLSQLKQSLESQGLSVDRLQVQQAPRDPNANPDPDARDNRDHQQQSHEQAGQQEEQRREMLRRLWRRVAGERDPLDLLA